MILSKVRHLIWVGLYAAFIGAAFFLRQHMLGTGASEIWGWDYQTFVSQINSWRWIAYTGFRHPGLGVVMSPLVVSQHIWSGAYLFVMPAIATATAFLIWRLAGWIGLLVWLSFPTTWILAGTPESFPMAQLVLIATVALILHNKNPLVAMICGAVNGLITITNGVKPLLTVKWKMRYLFVAGGVVLLGVLFFCLRSIVSGRSLLGGLQGTLVWIPETRNLPFEWYGFFIRPIGLAQSIVIYPVAIWAIVRLVGARDSSLMKILLPMFAVDALIHLVIGWGMSEPWVFAPHWIWMLPLLIGKGFCCENRSRL